MNTFCRTALLLAGLAIYGKPTVTASDWIGIAGDNIFSNPGNWNGPVPDAANSASFSMPASVEFSQSGAASHLNVWASTSFLLNGRTFQTSQTQIAGGMALLVRDGIASLGTVNLEGTLAATGAGSVISATSIQGNGFNSRVVQISNGAILQADSLNFNTGGFAMQVQSGAIATVGSLGLNTGQSLTVTGAGSSLTASGGIGGGGPVNVSSGGTVTTNFLGGPLNASGTGSFVQATTFSGSNVTVSDAATVSLGGSSSVIINSISVSGNGSLTSSLNLEGTVGVSSGGNLTANSLLLRGSSSVHQATVTSGNLSNTGVLDIRDSQVGSSSPGGSLNNTGALTGSFSTNYSLQNGGSVFVGEDETMIFRDGLNSSAISISGGSLEFSHGSLSNGGTISLSGDIRANSGFSNSGAVEVNGLGNIWGGNFVNHNTGSVAVFGSSTLNFKDDVQNDGTIAIGPGSTAVFYGGLSGSGQITGPGTAVLLGDLRPGHSPGLQTVEGDLVFGDTLAFSVEIDGLSQGVDYDAVLVGGLLSVDGSLIISLGDDYIPTLGDSFEVLTFVAREGDFDNYLGMNLEDGLSFASAWTDSALVLTVVPEPSVVQLLVVSITAGLLFSRKRKPFAHQRPALQ